MGGQLWNQTTRHKVDSKEKRFETQRGNRRIANLHDPPVFFQFTPIIVLVLFASGF